MSGRLPTGIVVSAMLRRVNDAGGIGVVRAKGDALAGGVLVVIAGRDADRVVERGIGADGRTTLIEVAPNFSPDHETDSIDKTEAYWLRRRSRDPDLWVIELDVPNAERFAAESLLHD